MTARVNTYQMLVTIIQPRVSEWLLCAWTQGSEDRWGQRRHSWPPLPSLSGACSSHCILVLLLHTANSRANCTQCLAVHKSLSHTFCPSAISTTLWGRWNYSHFIDEKTESLSDLWIWKFLWFQRVKLLHLHICFLTPMKRWTLGS